MEAVVIFILNWTVFLSSSTDNYASMGANIEKTRKTERYYAVRSTDSNNIISQYKNLPEAYKQTANITSRVRAGGEYFYREAGAFDVESFQNICRVFGHVTREYGKYDLWTSSYICVNCLAVIVPKFKEGETVFPAEAIVP